MSKHNELRARYRRAAHAVQSGVATEQELGSQDGTPKHLRVGINTAKAEQAALARLLIAKGIFTELEYMEAMAEGMEAEQKLYEERLTQRLGRPVTLG